MLEEIRDKLFGDVPITEWASPPQSENSGEPWRSFAAVRLAVESGDSASAIDTLRELASRPGLESRQYLQIWHFLRELGVQPPDAEAKRVLGVVLEGQLQGGLDLAADPMGGPLIAVGGKLMQALIARAQAKA